MYSGALAENAATRVRQGVTSPDPANIKNIHNISPSMWNGTTAVQRRKINQMTDAARKAAGII